MAVTNPDSLLDKNGLAYYHSKVKQEINRAASVVVNVTQSENQTIWYNVAGGHDSEMQPEGGYMALQGNGSGYTESGVFIEWFQTTVGITPEFGYKAGDLSLTINGRPLIEEEDYFWNGDYYIWVGVPRGGTLNISATPATQLPMYEVTLKRIQHPTLTPSSDELPSFTINGQTYQFSQSQDVTFYVPQGTEVDLRAIRPTNYYWSCTSSDVSITNTTYGSSTLRSYFTVSTDCEITYNAVHNTSNMTFYTKIAGQSGNYHHIDGVSGTVTYTDPDTNESVVKTLDFRTTLTNVSVEIPVGVTFDYSLTVPSGFVVDTGGGVWSEASGTMIKTSSTQSRTIRYATIEEYSYHVLFEYPSGNSASTTYKIYVNNTLVQSSSGTSAVVTGYDGDNFRVEIDPIEGYTPSQNVVTGTLGSGYQTTIIFTANPPDPVTIDDGGTPL